MKFKTHDGGTYVWTRTGKTIHVTDDGSMTRCGRPVFSRPTGRDLAYFNRCQKCEDQ